MFSLRKMLKTTRIIQPRLTQCRKNYCFHSPVNEKHVEKFLHYSIIIGGISGSSYVSRSIYTDIRDNSTYSEYVCAMTIGSIYGFVLGSAVGILTPIILPVASVASIVRYLYPPTSTLSPPIPPPPTITPPLCINLEYTE